MAEGPICLSPDPYRTNQILVGRVRIQILVATISTVCLAELTATGTSATRICLAGCLAITKQLGNWEANPDESGEERRDSLAVERWKGH